MTLKEKGASRKVKAIFETDPWLEPYKGDILSRHERIL